MDRPHRGGEALQQSIREGQAGQGGGGERGLEGRGMGAPPVLIGQATQRRGSTATVYKGRAGGPGGGGGGDARGGWRGGGGWGRLLY